MCLFFSSFRFWVPVLAVAFVFISSSCEKEVPLQNIEAFYYPIDSLREGMIYEYRLVNHDSFVPDFWFYRSTTEDSLTYLSKVLYDIDMTQRQLSRELRVSNGMLLSDIYFFERDSVQKLQQTQGQVISPNAFPFEVEDSTMVNFKVEFPLPNGRQMITINRRFMGDTTFIFNNKSFPAIFFELEGEVDIRDNIEGDISPPFWGSEIYAKGLGLVEYTRVTSPEVPMIHHRLKRMMPLMEFEEIYRDRF